MSRITLYSNWGYWDQLDGKTLLVCDEPGYNGVAKLG